MSIAVMLALAVVPGTATSPSVPDGNARICRKLPAPTGSRVPARRVCHTAAQWDALDRPAERDADAIRRWTSRQQGY